MFFEYDKQSSGSIEFYCNTEISTLYDFLKRMFDLVFALILSVIAIPLVLLICLCVVIESKGWPIYSQERLGKDETTFYIYKIRSMYSNAEEDGPRLTEKNDFRITRVGKLIRKIRFDELPQLYNILIGEMSFIGPRPERKQFTFLYERQIPGFVERLRVKPGLTGLAQVNGGYDITPQEKLNLDLTYIKNKGLLYDFKILLKTIPVVLKCKGAR